MCVFFDIKREGERQEGKGKKHKSNRHGFSPFKRISPPARNITATINPVKNVRGLSGRLAKTYMPTLKNSPPIKRLGQMEPTFIQFLGGKI